MVHDMFGMVWLLSIMISIELFVFAAASSEIIDNKPTKYLGLILDLMRQLKLNINVAV